MGIAFFFFFFNHKFLERTFGPNREAATPNAKSSHQSDSDNMVDTAPIKSISGPNPGFVDSVIETNINLIQCFVTSHNIEYV